MECFLVSLLNLEIFLVWNASIWVRLMATTWQRRGRRKSRDLQDGDKLARFRYFVYSFIWFHPLKYICVTHQANSDKQRVPWCWQGKNRTYVVDDYVHHSVFSMGLLNICVDLLLYTGYNSAFNSFVFPILSFDVHLYVRIAKPSSEWLLAIVRCSAFVLFFFSVQWHFHG